MVISVHEGLAIDVNAIKSWGKYNCLKISGTDMDVKRIEIKTYIYRRVHLYY